MIDTFGQAPSEVANGKKVSFVNKETAKSSKKCSFNDKGRCREGPDCHYQHSNVVCKSFSKHGSCDNYDDCLLRHPTGICLHWKKGHCNKDDMCFYRHPADEFGSMMDSQSPNMKRKRTFSNPNSPNQPNVSTDNHFLYQKYIQVSKELDAEKAKNSNLITDQIARQNPQFTAPNPANHFPGQNMSLQSHPANITGFYVTHPDGSTAGQAQHNFIGQAHPTVSVAAPALGWGAQMGANMQWGAGQGLPYPANQ